MFAGRKHDISRGGSSSNHLKSQPASSLRFEIWDLRSSTRKRIEDRKERREEKGREEKRDFFEAMWFLLLHFIRLLPCFYLRLTLLLSKTNSLSLPLWTNQDSYANSDRETSVKKAGKWQVNLHLQRSTEHLRKEGCFCLSCYSCFSFSFSHSFSSNHQIPFYSCLYPGRLKNYASVRDNLLSSKLQQQVTLLACVTFLQCDTLRMRSALQCLHYNASTTLVWSNFYPILNQSLKKSQTDDKFKINWRRRKSRTVFEAITSKWATTEER